MIDDQKAVNTVYQFTEAEYRTVIQGAFLSLDPLRMKIFPRREKRKFITLFPIISQFDPERFYTEGEVNQILKPIYDDHVTIRRYLVDYNFLARARDGSKYWVENRDFPECRL